MWRKERVKYCSLEFFPHLKFQRVNTGKHIKDEQHIGENGLKHFVFINVQQDLDYIQSLENSLTPLDDDILHEELDNNVKSGIEVERGAYTIYNVKSGIILNEFCMHQVFHYLNKSISDCKFGDKCKHAHMNDDLLSSIIGYVSYDGPKGNEIILGCVHCLYNRDMGYNTLLFNAFSDFYASFDNDSVINCIKYRFKNDILPTIINLTSFNFGKYDEIITHDYYYYGDENTPEMDIDEILFVIFQIDPNDTELSKEYATHTGRFA